MNTVEQNGHTPEPPKSSTPIVVGGGLAPGDDGTPWPVLTLVHGGMQVAIRMDLIAAEQLGELVSQALQAAMREARLQASGLVLPGQQGFPGGTAPPRKGMPAQ